MVLTVEWLMMALIKFLVAFAVATASALLSAEPIEIIAIGIGRSAVKLPP